MQAKKPPSDGLGWLMAVLNRQAGGKSAPSSPLAVAAALLAADQLTKALAMRYLPGLRIVLIRFLGQWGLTYTANPGIWLDKSLPAAYFPWLQAAGFVVILLLGLCLRFYRRFYRRRSYMDWAYAFVTAAFLGNLVLDRIFFGAARDFILTPFGVANLADVYVDLAVITFIVEMAVYRPARRLLRFGSPRRWQREWRMWGRFFWHDFRRRRR